MIIDPKKCVACGNCVAICPMGAIHIDPEIKRARSTRTSVSNATPASGE